MKQLISSRARALGVGALFFLIIFVDRVTKLLALSFLSDTSAVARCVLSGPCISFELVFNRGVSWGFLAPESAFWFAFLGMLIVGVTAVIACAAYTRWCAGISFFPELLIVAGSGANVIDRMLYGGVIDFIKLSWGAYSWPVFNGADCCIVLGVGLLALRIIKNK